MFSMFRRKNETDTSPQKDKLWQEKKHAYIHQIWCSVCIIFIGTQEDYIFTNPFGQVGVMIDC